MDLSPLAKSTSGSSHPDAAGALRLSRNRTRMPRETNSPRFRQRRIAAEHAGTICHKPGPLRSGRLLPCLPLPRPLNVCRKAEHEKLRDCETDNPGLCEKKARQLRTALLLQNDCLSTQVTWDQGVSVLIEGFMAIFHRRLFVVFRAPIDRHPLLEVVERLGRKAGHKFDDFLRRLSAWTLLLSLNRVCYVS